MNQDTPIDRATFAELQDSAGADFVKELTQTFFEEGPTLLRALEEALAAGDADAFRRAAHSLKSNGQTFGALGLAAQARALEHGGMASAQSGEALAALKAEFARATAALAELANG
jgi:HPt (histidine-containing phosphotransfer) domain-containing protein